MKQFVEKALFDLTGENNIDLVSVEALQRIADEHPFFPIAQLLLAKKLKVTQSETFTSQVQKTALFFSNTYLLHYHLADEISDLPFEKEAEENLISIEEPEEDNTNLEVTQNGNIQSSNEINAISKEIENKEDLRNEFVVEETFENEIKDEELVKEDFTNTLLEEDVTEQNFSERETITSEAVTFDDINEFEKSEDSLDKINVDETEGSGISSTSGLKEVEEDKVFTENVDPSNETSGAALGVDQNAPQDYNSDKEHSSSSEKINSLTPEENDLEARVADFDPASTDEQPADNIILTPHNIAQSNIPETIDEPGDLHLIPEEVSTTEDLQTADSIASNEVAKGGGPDKSLEQGDDAPQDESQKEHLEELQPDEVAPDPFHPEQEEILEELEQEKIDKEVEKSTASSTVESLPENHEITLPVHNEDNQIIDEFVEAQHHNVAVDNTTENKNVTPPAVAEQPKQDDLIPIEPYYTVDYFASQGIKFTPEKNPQDRLGKQLKSFTQWLKHMKKIGPEDAVKPNEESHVDTRIQGIADISNTKREVLTEAMADVLEKQGKTHQAIEVYNKLSFLNPDKSSYFADKIQKLKGI